MLYLWLRWVFIALQGLFSGCSERGLLSVTVLGPLMAVASLVVEHRLSSHSCGLQSSGSAMANGLSCSGARGVFLDQGSNPCPLRWQVGSYPPCHQGSPLLAYII